MHSAIAGVERDEREAARPKDPTKLDPHRVEAALVQRTRDLARPATNIRDAPLAAQRIRKHVEERAIERLVLELGVEVAA
jgi:hypothetical protein